jgi:hypothetical protein
MGVVTGNHIRAKLPWLYCLYQHELLEFAQKLSCCPLSCSQDSESAININILEGVGSSYERHIDHHPFTGLLFGSSSAGRGGSLVLEVGLTEVKIEPRAAEFLVFEGGSIPHYVQPLKSSWQRVSVPMNFNRAGESQADRAELNDYLYRSGVL